MSALRKFFGNLCGGSGSKNKIDEDDSPVDQPKEEAESASEPTISPTEVPTVAEAKPEDDSVLLQSSCESLEGSPRIEHKERNDSAVSIQKIYDVVAMKPDVLDMAVTDNIFQDAVQILNSFVKQCSEFKTCLLNFERRYSKDKRPDFRKCLQVHLKNKEALIHVEQISLEEPSIIPSTAVVADDSSSHLLVCIETSGKELLEIIEATTPKLDACITEAEKNDMKEYVKGKIEEEGQQGLLSKFSAPGKYRRNMKQLKKQRRLLDDIKGEVHLILSSIEQGKHSQTNDSISKEDHQLQLNQESNSCDESAADVTDGNHENETVIAEVINERLAEDSSPVRVHKNDISHQAENVSSDLGELQKSDHHHEKSEVTELDQTETVLNGSVHEERQVSENERGDLALPLRPLSPLITKAKLSDSWDKLDEGNLVDYGSYLLLDPGDDMPIMRRSRSMDSVSSMGSRRSMSRYGSYEFVTDYEIKIADKSETEKAKKM